MKEKKNKQIAKAQENIDKYQSKINEANEQLENSDLKKRKRKKIESMKKSYQNVVDSYQKQIDHFENENNPPEEKEEQLRVNNIKEAKEKIEEIDEQLSDPNLGEWKKKHLDKKKKNKLEFIEYQTALKEDPEYAEKLHQKYINESKFTNLGDKFESAGEKMQNVGSKMTKAGLHATGAVWTPVIYAGYHTVKQARKKPKNESIEQDLIELIQEVEQAHNDGKITEEQKRAYVIDFVDNFYKK